MLDLKAVVRPEIQALYEGMVEDRRDFHRHPELAFFENRTSAVVKKRLEELGFETRGMAKTGVLGELRGEKDAAKTLAFRADMDALPLQELGEKDYKSLYPGCMHACGHDGHTAMLLGFAKFLAAKKEGLAGNIKLLFQPAEEGEGGALPMIKEGALKNPDVDRLVGLHLWNDFPIGEAGVRGGAVMAAADEFILTITGKGGHGAQPQKAVDAISVAGHVICALNTIVARETDPLDPTVVTIGEVSGGSNFNIIAQEVRLRGTVRAVEEKTKDLIQKRIGEIAGGVCQAMGASCAYEYINHYPMTINDDTVARIVAKQIVDVVGKERLRTDGMSMGAEDMSYYLREVPGCFFFLGSSNVELGFDKPHHHPEYDFDERVMPIGVEIFARIAEEFFKRKF
jgi:amidohydrolase